MALLFAIQCFTISSGVYIIGRYWANAYVSTRLPYLILLLLFVPDFSQLLSEAPIIWLGSAFFIVRQMMTVAQSLKKLCGFSDFFPALLLCTFFFAALPSGPVFSGIKCWSILKENRLPHYAGGSYRIFEGFVYLFAVAGFIDLFLKTPHVPYAEIPWVASISHSVMLDLIIHLIGSFLLLFSTFYGYSRMAEGAALLFGFEVPENFNKPHLAQDLGDFWQRWHRSMAEFVMQYIYLPMLVSGLSTRISIIAAFVFMGLWHNLSCNFLLWGLGHGVGQANLIPWAQKTLPPTVLRLISLCYVLLLSGVAHGFSES